MSSPNTSGKERIALMASIVLNIFFVAFILGRISVFGLMPPPPPPFFRGGEFGMHGGPPPGFPPMQDRMEGHRPYPPMGNAGMPPAPPPPFFSPADLFTPEEMKQDFAKMQENFEKMGTLRQDFGKQLEQGPVSREDVLKHFAAIDQLMENVKKQMQEKAAEKIGTMSPEERKRFADKLLERQ